VEAPVLLALTAGMLGAVNPCGFALLPAYLSVLVAGDPTRPDGPAATARAVGRALRCTAALTVGYVAVFGAFGLLLAPVSDWLQPRLPWLTVVLGLALAGLGGRLLSGRSLPAPGRGLRAPRLTGSPASMVLFGTVYALSSLGCAAGPFLALVVSGLRAGSLGEGLLRYAAYAAGMGLVVGVAATAVALARLPVLTALRRTAGVVPRLGGAVLLVTGGYVAWYGWYELRLRKDRGTSGHDPVVAVVSDWQHGLSDLVGRAGAAGFAGAFLVLAFLGVAGSLLTRRSRAAAVRPPGTGRPAEMVAGERG
jgi:cytochrome c biogenesis protein CcdA